ncbi:MAG: lipoprotein [Gammaproteobacteria bacterium]|jgi:predicted small lipoprotein YifL
MRTDIRRCRRALVLMAALVLSGCGQTGPLVLPGSQSPPAQPSESSDEEEDTGNEAAQ